MTYKDFAAGDIFTADDADLLMRQGLIIVANQAARDAISAPENGMRVYRSDTRGIDRRIAGVWVESTTWTALTLASGITYTTAVVPAYLVDDGTLMLRGLPTQASGLTNNLLVATLPAGARPTQTFRGLGVCSDSVARRLDVDTAGRILLNASGSTIAATWQCLDMVSFRLYE